MKEKRKEDIWIYAWRSSNQLIKNSVKKRRTKFKALYVGGRAREKNTTLARCQVLPVSFADSWQDKSITLPNLWGDHQGTSQWPSGNKQLICCCSPPLHGLEWDFWSLIPYKLWPCASCCASHLQVLHKQINCRYLWAHLNNLLSEKWASLWAPAELA